MKKKYSFLFLLVLLFSCSKEDIDTKDDVEIAILPEVVTNPVTEFSIFTLTVNGKLMTETASEIIEVGFVIDNFKTPSLESNFIKTTALLNDDNTFSVIYESIPSSIDLHIKAYVINTDGISYGNEIVFTTLPEKVYNGTSIYLTNQEEVDDFAANEYTTVNAGIYIEGSGINSIKGLESIVMINNQIYIRYTNLVSLEGLDNLKFCASTVQIESNQILSSLNGLNNLKECGHFNVMDNPSLINLQGLDALEYIRYPGNFRIQNNQNLENLSGLNNFKTISSGNLFIMYNPKLNSIEGLSNLNFIAFEIYIVENPMLASLTGLEQITKVEGLRITDNASLQNLNPLSNLETIATALQIQNNSSLTSLNGLQNLKNIGVSFFGSNNFYLQIINNQNLTNLNGLENITSSSKRVNYEINSNSNLVDFCGIRNLIANNLMLNFYIFDNAINPTIIEIMNSCQ